MFKELCVLTLSRLTATVGIKYLHPQNLAVLSLKETLNIDTVLLLSTRMPHGDTTLPLLRTEL